MYENSVLIHTKSNVHVFFVFSYIRSTHSYQLILGSMYFPLAHGAVLKDQSLKNVGLAHNKTSAQIAMRWILQNQKGWVEKSNSSGGAIRIFRVGWGAEH